MPKRNQPPFTLRTEWKAGPSNAAWDELWRRIFDAPLRGFTITDLGSDGR